MFQKAYIFIFKEEKTMKSNHNYQNLFQDAKKQVKTALDSYLNLSSEWKVAIKIVIKPILSLMAISFGVILTYAGWEICIRVVMACICVIMLIFGIVFLTANNYQKKPCISLLY